MVGLCPESILLTLLEMAFTRIALLGASGKLGPSLLQALDSAQCFHIVVIGRSNTPVTTCSSSVTHVSSDYSKSSLTPIFEDHRTEAVVCCLGGAAAGLQTSDIIPAAIAAGVMCFIPSEFGTDTLNPAVQKRMPSTKVKVDVIDCLRDASQSATHPLSWTALACGALFDLVMATGFIGFDLAAKRATLYDGGELEFPATTMSVVGKAVVQVLKRPEATKNCYIYIKEFSATGQGIVKALESIERERWTVTQRSTQDVLEEAEVKFKAKDIAGWISLVQRTIYYDKTLGGSQAWSQEDAIGLLNSIETKSMEARLEELLHENM